MSDSIETNKDKPKSATVDGNTVTQHSLPDQIEADRYLREKNAVKGQKRGLNYTRFRPPGAT